MARAPAATPTAPPSEGEQDGFGEELDADVAFGGAERAAQPDLGPAFEHGDDHDVGDADGADEQRYGAEAEEQAVERALGVGAGDQRLGGLAHVDLARGLGLAAAARSDWTASTWLVWARHVDGRGMTVGAEVGFRGRGSRRGRRCRCRGRARPGLRIPAT